ncbi:MAG: biotin--[acetyl-CoA-carboxylase] ligase [Desulfarculaceae bacterium]|nr:biotin--[acetyl-CoA-carboxylase] ligase [Desulfarculaceae bacterium]
MKEHILHLLYSNSGQVVSGTTLSEHLGISRVAVWKHVKNLKQSGWPIVSTSRGYILEHPRDLLLPFCFADRTNQIYHFTETVSTMDAAKELARKGAPHMSLVLAERQTGGRGRLSREWHSQDGGIWCTLILRPTIPFAYTYQLNFAASVALVETLRDETGIDATVKWPNDILAGRKKIAGLLSEMETHGDMLSFLNIGIGLNVNNTPPETVEDAASIRSLTGPGVSRQKLVNRFLDRFEELYNQIREIDIIAIWKAYTSTIGARVAVETHNARFEGIAVDVDPTGALIIETCDGTTKKVIYGDCFYKENNQ